MSAGKAMVLTLLVIGALIWLGFGLDWSPDITREEWAEQHGGQVRHDAMQALRELQAQERLEMQGYQQEQQAREADRQKLIQQISDDVAICQELVEADDEDSAIQLAGYFARYPPARYQPSDRRRLVGEDVLDLAHERIRQALIGSDNSHLAAALVEADAPAGWHEFPVAVAEILQARDGENDLPAVMALRARRCMNPPYTQAQADALLESYAAEALLEQCKAELQSGDRKRQELALAVLVDIGTPPAAEVLLSQLHGVDDDRRWREMLGATMAMDAQTLTACRAELLKTLEAALAEGGYSRRDMALKSLGQIGTADAARIVLAHSDRMDDRVADALAAMGPVAVDPIVDALRESPERKDVRSLVEALAMIDVPAVLPGMIEALGLEHRGAVRLASGYLANYALDPESREQRRRPRMTLDNDDAETIGLSQQDDPLAPAEDVGKLEAAKTRVLTTQLIAALRHQRPAVRAAVVELLADQQDDRRHGAIIQACLDRDPAVLEAAAAALAGGNYDNTTSSRHLAQYITSLPVGKAAMKNGGLHTLSRERLIQILAAATGKGATFEADALTVLSRLEPELTPEMRNVFFAALMSEGQRLSKAAWRGLAASITPKQVPQLANLRQSPHEHVRQNAVLLLGHIGGPEAVKPLVAAFTTDESQTVRDLAGRILADMTDAPSLVDPMYAWGYACFRSPRRAKRLWKMSQAVRADIRRDPARYLKDLDGEDPTRRAYAALWLIEDDRPDVRGAVLKRLDGGDVMVAKAVYKQLTSEEVGKHSATLIRAMNDKSWPEPNYEMAEYFLNFGGAAMEQAARKWASDNGYRVETRVEWY